jgi:hypothetical protein
MTSSIDTCVIEISSSDVIKSDDLEPSVQFADFAQLVESVCKLSLNMNSDFEACSELRTMIQRDISSAMRSTEQHSRLHCLLHLTQPQLRCIMQTGLIDIFIDSHRVSVYEFTNAVTLFIERPSGLPVPIQTSFD